MNPEVLPGDLVNLNGFFSITLYGTAAAVKEVSTFGKGFPPRILEIGSFSEKDLAIVVASEIWTPYVERTLYLHRIFTSNGVFGWTHDYVLRPVARVRSRRKKGQ